ncbi:MAG TPA: alpha/beta hydrolase [Longimicrobiales bacterium]|nr:alpha/beta hydrolase [Longimicrobiales bacterium]
MGEAGVTAGVLNTQEVAAEGASPAAWMAMLHGIYGAGRNWGSVARGLVAARPEWGALLVDLRQHGGSMGFPPPHTLTATAADLESLAAPGPLRAVLGHSFGGKVALAYARGAEAVAQVWVVDSTPEVREPEGGAWNMLEILRRVPDRFGERDEAVAALVRKGVRKPIAAWMTTNLEWTGEEYRWRLDLDEMETLLRSFFETDLWDVVESPPERLTVHVIRATESSVLGDDAAARIRAAGEATGRVHLHDVQGAHWLNADNPEALVSLLAERL